MMNFRSAAFAVMVLTIAATSAHANSGVQWGGQYRVEAVWLDDPTLGHTGEGHRYGLHHLSLKPEIVPADRFLIRGQVEVFNSNQYAESNTLGEFWGGQARTPTTSTNPPEDSYSTRRALDYGLISVSQLYLQWFQDYGTLKVGRAPIEFGLGMSYSAGNGPWDHWMTTRDVLSYTIHMGNFSFTPTYAKLNEGRVQVEDDVNEIMLEAHYENVDTGLEGGIHHRARRASKFGNDIATPPGFTNALGVFGLEEDHTSFYFRRKKEWWSFGLELAFVEGALGYVEPLGRSVGINSFGMAAELKVQKPNSKWEWGLWAGLASGDNPGTNDTYEGFLFDKNYDVSLLMFNHVLGFRGNNILGTSGVTRVADGGTDANSLPLDVETISNTLYFSPRAKVDWSEKFSLEGRLTFATLREAAAGWDKDLGYEFDLIGDYTINSRVTWRNGFAFFFPGDAFTGVNSAYPNSFTFGWISQAAIQF
jgi:hypothetical protein